MVSLLLFLAEREPEGEALLVFLLDVFLRFFEPLVSEEVTFFFVALTSYSSSLSESLELLDSLSDDSDATSPSPKALVSSSSSLSDSSELLLESEDDLSEIV